MPGTFLGAIKKAGMRSMNQWNLCSKGERVNKYFSNNGRYMFQRKIRKSNRKVSGGVLSFIGKPENSCLRTWHLIRELNKGGLERGRTEQLGGYGHGPSRNIEDHSCRISRCRVMSTESNSSQEIYSARKNIF